MSCYPLVCINPVHSSEFALNFQLENKSMHFQVKLEIIFSIDIDGF